MHAPTNTEQRIFDHNNSVHASSHGQPPVEGKEGVGGGDRVQQVARDMLCGGLAGGLASGRDFC